MIAGFTHMKAAVTLSIRVQLKPSLNSDIFLTEGPSAFPQEGGRCRAPSGLRGENQLAAAKLSHMLGLCTPRLHIDRHVL